jgi:hypothetical protein
MSEKQGHQLADIFVLLFDININRDSQIFAQRRAGIITQGNINYTLLQAKPLSFASSRGFKLTQNYGIVAHPLYLCEI